MNRRTHRDHRGNSYFKRLPVSLASIRILFVFLSDLGALRGLSLRPLSDTEQALGRVFYL